MNSSKKINFGIVGCGMISHMHTKALLEIPEANLLGAWDLDKNKKAEFCNKYNIAQYASFDDMLNDKKIDAVCICTPSVCHSQQAIKALNSGKHVVLEKPMALNVTEAKKICDAVAANARNLTVIFQTRFAEEIIYLKHLIDNNVFGKLCFCDLYMKYYREPSYYSESSWRGTLQYDGGGALMNQGIHGIDLMHFLVGKAQLISGKIKTLIHDIETEDSAVAILEYDCGALGVIEGSTATSPGFRRRIEINGENGYAILSDTTIEKLFLNGKMIISKDIDPHPETAKSPALTNAELHKAQLSDFIDSIKNNSQPSINADDGYYAVKLIEDIYNSSKNHITKG